MAKLAGVVLCIAGAFAIAFYTGPSLSPINHHRAFRADHHHATKARASQGTTMWIVGTFLMFLSNVTWSLWMVLQAMLLEEVPQQDAHHHGAVRAENGTIVRHRGGCREGLLQVEAPP